jgi:hypothetical protein
MVAPAATSRPRHVGRHRRRRWQESVHGSEDGLTMTRRVRGCERARGRQANRDPPSHPQRRLLPQRAPPHPHRLHIRMIGTARDADYSMTQRGEDDPWSHPQRRATRRLSQLDDASKARRERICSAHLPAHTVRGQRGCRLLHDAKRCEGTGARREGRRSTVAPAATSHAPPPLPAR